MFFQVLPGEPVYAHVNRDKKKNSRNHQQPPTQPPPQQGYHDYSDEHWQVANSQGTPLDQSGGPAGDSWV